MTLTDLYIRYSADFPQKKETQQDYGQMLKRLAASLGREPTIADLKTPALESFIRYQHESGAATRIINKHAECVQALWNYAHDLRLVLWPAPSPRIYFDPQAPGLIVKPDKQRGRKPGAWRQGASVRPACTKLDKTLWSHFQLMYRRQRLLGKSAETARLYGYSIGYFAEFLGREPELKDLADEMIVNLMEWIALENLPDGRQGRGLSMRTANKTRDQLCALWNFLGRKGIVKTFPEVPSLPEPQRTPQAWSKDELAKLWNLCANQRGHICGVPAGKWWLAIHSAAWDSFERIGALRQLLWSDVSADCEWVHIRAEIRKGKRRDQTAKMHPITVVLLAEIRRADNEHVFGWDQNYSYFWTKYKNMRRSVGLNTDHLHSFHALRRTGASFAEAAGHDATRLLGHSSRKVTEKHYLDPKILPQIHGADILFRPDAVAGGFSNTKGKP